MVGLINSMEYNLIRNHRVLNVTFSVEISDLFESVISPFFALLAPMLGVESPNNELPKKSTVGYSSKLAKIVDASTGMAG